MLANNQAHWMQITFVIQLTLNRGVPVQRLVRSHLTLTYAASLC